MFRSFNKDLVKVLSGENPLMKCFLFRTNTALFKLMKQRVREEKLKLDLQLYVAAKEKIDIAGSNSY